MTAISSLTCNKFIIKKVYQQFINYLKVNPDKFTDKELTFMSEEFVIKYHLN